MALPHEGKSNPDLRVVIPVLSLADRAGAGSGLGHAVSVAARSRLRLCRKAWRGDALRCGTIRRRDFTAALAVLGFFVCCAPSARRSTMATRAPGQSSTEGLPAGRNLARPGQAVWPDGRSLAQVTTASSSMPRASRRSPLLPCRCQPRARRTALGGHPLASLRE